MAFCIEHGKDYPLTIQTYGVSYPQIYFWVRKYEEKGVDGLADGRGRTKAESEMDELEKLRAQNKLLQAQIKDKEMEILLLKKRISHRTVVLHCALKPIFLLQMEKSKQKPF